MTALQLLENLLQRLNQHVGRLLRQGGIFLCTMRIQLPGLYQNRIRITCFSRSALPHAVTSPWLLLMTTRARWVAMRKDAITVIDHKLLLLFLASMHWRQCISRGGFDPGQGPGPGPGPGARGDGPIGRAEARQSRETGISSEIGPLTRISEHGGSRMGRNGRRFQIDALQGHSWRYRGSCPVDAMSRGSHQQGRAAVPRRVL